MIFFNFFLCANSVSFIACALLYKTKFSIVLNNYPLFLCVLK